MAEDLLSRLANPDRYNMLKEMGRIDEKKIFEEQIDAQPRAQNLKPARPLENNAIQIQQVVERKNEVDHLNGAAKHPEQNTLTAFSIVKEEPKTVEEVKSVETPTEAKIEPQIFEQKQEVKQFEVKKDPFLDVPNEPIREITKSYIPEPPRDVQGKSITMEDIDVKKVETFFNKLIGGSL